MLFLSNVALALALVVNPWLLARNLNRKADSLTTLALAGGCLVSLGLAAPILLHLIHLPVAPGPLSLLHALVFALLLALSMLRHIPPCPDPIAGQSPFPTGTLGKMSLLFALLVLPFTPIAGIDTYKWQDLAGAVRVAKSIPWLIHPASLLGFTPRSYPSAQPLLLATISILSGATVDWSFYILSVSCGIIGLVSTAALARRLFRNPSTALWMTFLYVFSPVFLRYSFWATGRGLFMALLPLFALSLLHGLRVGTLPAALGCALLLGMSHKAAMAAVPLVPIAFLAGALVFPAEPSHSSPPQGFSRLVRIGLPCVFIMGALAAGYTVAQHSAWTMATRLTTRLAFLMPLYLFGSLFLFLPRNGAPPSRAMAMMALLALPAVCTDLMYGSLIASLFITYPAAIGIEQLLSHSSPNTRPRLLAPTVAAMLIPAIMIIVHQSADSPSRDVVRVAGFLNRHDPLGPYRIEAPGITRTRIQAYLDGCPRFNVFAPDQTGLKPMPLPQLTGPLHKDVRILTDYLRHWIVLPDASTDWYGTDPKVYFVTVDGAGQVPAGARLLFTSGNVSLYDAPTKP